MPSIFLMVAFWRTLFIRSALMHGGVSCKLGRPSIKGQVGGLEMVKKIDVWNYHWLPEPTSSMIVSPKSSSLVFQVCDLFYSNSRIWDPGKLASCFLPWEVKVVGRIHVSDGWDEDILIWPLTLDGEYSVKSAFVC